MKPTFNGKARGGISNGIMLIFLTGSTYDFGLWNRFYIFYTTLHQWKYARGAAILFLRYAEWQQTYMLINIQVWEY